MARLGAIALNHRDTHTILERPANVTPFDIIINTSENALKDRANSQRKMRLSEREMLY
jgi:hypothetical protein